MATAFIPTREDVSTLKVGDLAPDPFGRMRKVTEIHARREDISGKLFACYYVESSPTSQVSGSIKEGRLVRHAGLRLNSAQTDSLEREMLSKGERIREV